MIGVSPAFVVCLHGRGFTVRDFCKAIPVISDIGFSAYQPEIYVGTALPEWLRDCRDVHRAASDCGLAPTQFVAHFMLEQFASPEQLHPRQGLDDLKKVIEIMQAFPPCEVLTIPAGHFVPDRGSSWPVTAGGWKEVRLRLFEKVAHYVEIVGGAGLKLAFEVLPFSIFGGISRYVSLCREIGSQSLGLNFDTGHAWACGELLTSLPFEVEEKIFGTHLGDSTGTENMKVAPGKGAIPWRPLLEGLGNAGYHGSLDIEIMCNSDQVVTEYSAGLAYVRSLNAIG